MALTDNTPLTAAAQTPLTRLHENRTKRWHQNGEALLSFENLRSWLNAAGLVLFVPRPQIAAPAPSLVEAVLGAAAATPTLEQSKEARVLLARLIGEGVAVPLSLLGSPSGAVGDTPDFVASAAVFSYIFTMRGDKGWKQPPSTSGPNKVSQLAAHTYEILAKSGPRSASDLTPELGNAVTETAVLRALGELWTHLRVLPMPQVDDRPTLWELASTRYTKQIKAGANAGQPSALSALISLYLGQVAVATEDDIEVFLSPLAPRSRIRDVVHALTAARQLDTVAIEGRIMVHLAGEAPEFVNGEQPAPREVVEAVSVAGEEGAEVEGEGAEAAEAGEGARIKKFVPKPRKVGTGYLSKGAPAKGAGKSFGKDRPVRGERPAFGKPERAPRGERPASGRPERRTPGERPAFGRAERGERPAFGSSERRAPGARFEGKPDRERRPFQKSRAEGDTKPQFDRPWNEDRPKRPARREDERGSFAGPRSASDRPRTRPSAGGEGKAGGWKPAYRDKSGPPREGFREGAQRPPRREGGFAPRGERPDRFAKGPGGPKRPFRSEGGMNAGERPERPFRRFDARPGMKRPFTKRTDEGGTGERPARTFRPRPEGASAPGGREDRAPREFGSRDRKPSKFASKFAGKRPGPRAGGGFSARPRPEGGFSARPRPEGGSSTRPRPEGGFAARPRPAGRGGDRPFGGAGASGKRPAKRTFKRKEDESA